MVLNYVMYCDCVHVVDEYTISVQSMVWSIDVQEIKSLDHKIISNDGCLGISVKW